MTHNFTVPMDGLLGPLTIIEAPVQQKDHEGWSPSTREAALERVQACKSYPELCAVAALSLGSSRKAWGDDFDACVAVAALWQDLPTMAVSSEEGPAMGYWAGCSRYLAGASGEKVSLELSKRRLEKMLSPVSTPADGELVCSQTLALDAKSMARAIGASVEEVLRFGLAGTSAHASARPAARSYNWLHLDDQLGRNEAMKTLSRSDEFTNGDWAEPLRALTREWGFAAARLRPEPCLAKIGKNVEELRIACEGFANLGLDPLKVGLGRAMIGHGGAAQNVGGWCMTDTPCIEMPALCLGHDSPGEARSTACHEYGHFVSNWFRANRSAASDPVAAAKKELVSPHSDLSPPSIKNTPVEKRIWFPGQAPALQSIKNFGRLVALSVAELKAHPAAAAVWDDILSRRALKAERAKRFDLSDYAFSSQLRDGAMNAVLRLRKESLGWPKSEPLSFASRHGGYYGDREEMLARSFELLEPAIPVDRLKSLCMPHGLEAKRAASLARKILSEFKVAIGESPEAEQVRELERLSRKISKRREKDDNVRQKYSEPGKFDR